MRTVILGKKIENYYDVDHKWTTVEGENGGSKTVYTAKPALIKTPKIEWAEICSYEGEPRYNSKTSGAFGWSGIFCMRTINISKDETVTIEEEVFRADLNEMHLKTNKVIEEIDVDGQEARANLSEPIRAFNSMMITSNEKLKSYCDIHNLSYENTDAIELFGIVFPNEQYEIVNGVMKVKERHRLAYISSANGNWINTNLTNITIKSSI